jgi:hypothetical protein
MRPQDRDECVAVRGHFPTPMELWRAIEQQDEAYAVWTQSSLVCLYGVNAGTVWLLGTTELDARMLSLCRHARPIISRWLAKYGELSNLTHSRNTAVLRWLRWLGFTLGPETAINGQPFTPFRLVTSPPCAIP